MKKNIIKILKIFGYFFLIISIILIIAILLLRLPSMQNKVKNYALGFLEEKINTEVSLEKLYVSFPAGVAIEKIYFEDQNADTLFYADKIDVGIYLPDLLRNKISLSSVDIKKLRVNIHRDEQRVFNFDYIINAFASKDTATTEQKTWDISVGDIDFEDISLNYKDNFEKNDIRATFQDLEISVDEFDLEKQRFEIDKFLFADADISVNLFMPEEKAPKTEVTEEDVVEENLAATVFLDNLELKNVRFVYNNMAIPRKAEGMDFNHLNFQELNLTMEDFKMQDGTFKGKVSDAKIKEQNHLSIREFQTKFKYAEKEAYLKKFLLKTEHSIFRGDVELFYDEMAQLTENTASVAITASLDENSISFQDILRFMPSLGSDLPFAEYPNAILHFDAKTEGRIGALNIQNLTAYGIGDLKLSVEGMVKNVLDTDNLYYDLNIKNVESSASTIKKMTPPNTLPESISLPTKIQLWGTVKGSTKEIDASIGLKSSAGGASLSAYVNMLQKNEEEYDVKLELDDFNVGKVFQNKKLEKITANISAKGHSFDFAKGNIKIDGNLLSLSYKDYHYDDIQINGYLKDSQYEARLVSEDPNIALNISAKGKYSQEKTTLDLEGFIKNIDFHKINLYDEPLDFTGELEGQFENVNLNKLNGNFRLTNFILSDNNEIFRQNDIKFKATSTEKNNTLSLKSSIADFNLTGKFKLTEIFSSIVNTANEYYQFQKDSIQNDSTLNQNLKLEAEFRDDDIIRKFLPELKNFEPITFSLDYNAKTKDLKVDGKIPGVTYGENHFENGTLEINTQKERLGYNLVMGSIRNELLQLDHVKLKGGVRNNILDFNVSTEGLEGKEQYSIAGEMKLIDDSHRISLLPKGVKLNYDEWQVAENNFIKIDDEGIIAKDFILTNKESSIKIQSENNSVNSPIKLQFNNFSIATLTEIVKKDKLLADGVLSGEATLNNLQSGVTFTSDLSIKNLNIYEQLVGSIQSKISNKTNDLVDIELLLKDEGNDVNISGIFNMSDSSFDLSVGLNKLQMKSLEGFSLGQLEAGEGYFSGQFNITGTAGTPNVEGILDFNDIGFRISQTGSNFRHINDKIRFHKNDIVFREFKLNDSDGNSLTVDGKIKTKTYRDFAFDLAITADDFKVVDSEEDNDQIMYGLLSIDSKLNVGGSMESPVVDGSIAVTEQSDFTFILPQSTPTLKDRKGVVRFVDKDKYTRDAKMSQKVVSADSKLKGMNISAELSVNEDAKISLIIDKTTGDFVELQGKAKLTGGIDPSGKTTLVGVYEVQKGAYELNVNMLNRRFDIEKGSTITWNGDPLEADVDFIANYKIDAAPIDLLQQQLSGLSPREYNMYKQRIPFNTLLKLKGELMKPKVKFDITIDKDNASVASTIIDNTQAKLQQIRQNQSEINKQVFALLLLNRFIGENPFASESGMSAGTMARQSASKILSQQLNNLASDLISGVDLDFNFNSYDDYSQGQKNTRTDLNVGVSKKLFNDRLKVTVGSKFGVEGEARKNEELTTIAGDLNIEYMLSKNGRYTLRAFRINEYEVALQGQIVETGLGFIIKLEFDKFMDIFQKSKNKKAESK